MPKNIFTRPEQPGQSEMIGSEAMGCFLGSVSSPAGHLSQQANESQESFDNDMKFGGNFGENYMNFGSGAELRKEIDAFAHACSTGIVDQETRNQNGGEDLMECLDEHGERLSSLVQSAMSVANIDKLWSSRVLIYRKSEGESEKEDAGSDAPSSATPKNRKVERRKIKRTYRVKIDKKWDFSRAIPMNAGILLDPKESLRSVMNACWKLDNIEKMPSAVAVWVMPISRERSFFWARHYLGASVAGFLCDGTTMLVGRGERMCQLLADSAIMRASQSITLQGDGLGLWLSKRNEYANFVRSECKEKADAIFKSIKSIKSDESTENDEKLTDNQWRDLVSVILPSDSFMPFMESIADEIATPLVNEMHHREHAMLFAFEKVADRLRDQVREIEENHASMREKEKRRFIKELESREKTGAGYLSRAKRIDEENQKLLKEIQQLKSRTAKGASAIQGVGTEESDKRHSDLAIALDEIFS